MAFSTNLVKMKIFASMRKFCSFHMGTLMTTFDKREQAFEAKLAHDEELKFKANVRRNKWLGLWAAEKLGKTSAEAEDYATSLIAVDLDESSGDEVVKKVRADFDKAGVALSEHQIRRKMEELLAAAVEEIKTVAVDAKARPLDH
jgi:hypothetical protein